MTPDRTASDEAGSAQADGLSYARLRRLLVAVGRPFDVRPLAEAFEPANNRPVLVLRHDVDVSLDAALRLAELEADLGVRASFLVMLDWPLYDVRALEGRRVLRRLRELGHDVGLHVDPRTPTAANDATLAVARDRLAVATGAVVRSLSFHRPTPACLHGETKIAGMVNAYGRPLMRCYLSDSRGRFEVGDPARALMGATGAVRQLLLHPIWWGERHLQPRDRLRELVGIRRAELGAAGAQRFAEKLAAALPAVSLA
ncbi:MAG: hypothetical protein V7607_2497 [Solirubrobacteraceae bacterium]